jgi:hypothetical protein
MTCSFGGGVYPSIRTGTSPMLQKTSGTRPASVAASTRGPADSQVRAHRIARRKALNYRFTTVIVICDGYRTEWCTTLCATTPVTSS